MNSKGGRGAIFGDSGTSMRIEDHMDDVDDILREEEIQIKKDLRPYSVIADSVTKEESLDE